jgi:hypothetical protein
MAIGRVTLSHSFILPTHGIMWSIVTVFVIIRILNLHDRPQGR